MLQLYSKGCQYVIRVLSHMSGKDVKEGFSLSVICRKAGAPLAFTRKIFQALVKNRVLKARHGPGGGYSFRSPLERLSVLELMKAVDGENIFDKCIMGQARCSQKNACAIHPVWKKVRGFLKSELSLLTADKLVRKSFLIRNTEKVKGDRGV